ncbi:MAG: 3-phosphoshikimate 1-carboxyvinyltransferase [Clostridium sp.]|nr:3-phosphoshikimate 1-carboxyvinyltransferase [Clostridium sp.]
MKISHASPLRGELAIPGDKSISHRSVMFGAIAGGITEIDGFLAGADCLSTISCFRQLGIDIDLCPSADGMRVLVRGKGLHGLSASDTVLDAGDSGTTARLLSGILAGQPFTSRLTGDALIQKRPMKRIITPLTQMGASFVCEYGNNCLPFSVSGGNLRGISYKSPVASAQVKSAVLLAGLFAEGKTSVTEPALSRDHTERMLSGFGAELSREDLTVTISPAKELFGQHILVPGDISSAAYFLCAGLLVPRSEILVKNVGINPTRAGILSVLTRMGADLELLNPREVSGEPVADILVRHTPSLKGTEIGGAEIPALIDELPVIAALACFAEGTTVIRDASELRVKETDRIAVMTEVLSAMGADITPAEDGMVIRGGRPLHGAETDSHGDHRVAMSLAVAALAAEGTTAIRGVDCVDISYPGFFRDLARLQGDHN